MGALDGRDDLAADGQIERRLGRVVAALVDDADGAPAQVVGQRRVGRIDDGEALGADVVDHPRVDLVPSLVLHHPDVDGHGGPVGNDGIGLGADEPARQPADGERRVEHDAVEVVVGQAHAQLLREARQIERQLRHHPALRRRRPHHVLLEALDERRAVGSGHGRQQAIELPRRVGHGEVARVQVAPGALDDQLDLHHAARPAGNGGAAARVLGPVRHDDDVGGEQVAMRLGERAEERAADLLLAVEDELHVDARREPHRVHQLDRVQVTPDRPLVVRGAASVEEEAAQLVVADTGERDLGRFAFGEPAPEDGLDRIRLKPSLQGNGLGVVVAIDQHGARGPRHPALAEYRRVAAGLEDAPAEAAGPHRGGQPFAGGPNLVGLLAHGVQAEEIGEALDDGAAARREQPVERGPVSRHGARIPQPRRLLLERLLALLS